MAIQYFITDVFTQEPLKGNPVAVFTGAIGLGTVLMQKIANEINLSETVFVFPPDKDGHYKVKIFTPVNELPFAGHPTIGAAIVLSSSCASNEIKLETKMGTISFSLKRDSKGRAYEATMKQPIPESEQYEHADFLLSALNLEKSTLPIEIYTNGPRHVYVGLKSPEELSGLTPDHRMLAELDNVAINCFAKNNNFWQMRMFSPAYGVVEDAGTGSAAGPLALHLAKHNLIKFNEKIQIKQGVEMGRNSVMYAKLEGSINAIEAIKVTGSAVVIAKGEFFI